VSTALPASFVASQQYVNPGDAGYYKMSSDVSFGPAGVDLTPAGTNYPGNFSYVVYRVDDVTQTPKSLAVDFGLQVPGAECGVAAYNWAYGSLGRWEGLYYGSPSGQLNVNLDIPGADFTNAGDDLAFVVFCFNPSAIELADFTLSDLSVQDFPPYAEVDANPGSGQVPLNVTLDGSNSSDDLGIADYQFDPEGDGNWVDQGMIPTLDHTYNTPGAYTAKIKVTDTSAQSSTSQTTVIVSPATYDEKENNDDMASANTLPSIPFQNFSGNCGTGGNYDGDTDDWFTFPANTGDSIYFTLPYGANADMYIELWDSSGNGFPLTSGFGNPATLQYTFGGFEQAPYFLHVVCDIDQSDYFLNCSNTIPPSYLEFEDNDDVNSANELWDLDDFHSLSGWIGSLGSGPGYPGYDGDSGDWTSFTAPAGSTIDMTLTYDSGTGKQGITLLDSDGDVLANSADGDGSEHINYTLQAGDNGPYFFHLAAGSGYSDYQLDGTVTANNPGLDEQEDNDSDAQANPLPAIPFSGFTGNVGDTGTYDGDTLDEFSFTATSGQIVKFTITPTDTSVELSADIFDSNVNALGGGRWNSASGVVTAYAVIRTNDTGPYYVQVQAVNSGESTDYSIDAQTVTSYWEAEDNDTNLEANALPQNYSGLVANLGPGGNDGDTIDEFSFTAEVGSNPIHDIVYDDSLGTVTAAIYDSNGVLKASSSDQGGGVLYCDFDTQVDPSDAQPYYFVIQSSSGTTNYWIKNYDSYHQ